MKGDGKGMKKTPQEQFYEVYEPLRKKHQLFSHIKATSLKPDEDFIEIYKGFGNERKLLYRAKGEIEDCYKQMVLNLTTFRNEQKKREPGKLSSSCST